MKNALLALTAIAGLAAAGASTRAEAAAVAPAPVTVQQSAAVQNVGWHCDWRCRRHREWEWRHRRHY